MRSPYMTKQELCDAVYRTVLTSGTPLTRLEIARAIGKKKTPRIIDMVEGLVTGGWLSKNEGVDKFGRAAFFYGVGTIQPDSEEACREVA